MAAKPEQADAFPEGAPGVGANRNKKLDALADKFAELRDEKAALATKMGQTEEKILEEMQASGIKLYRYADREVKIKDGKAHVKVKTVKVGDGN